MATQLVAISIGSNRTVVVETEDPRADRAGAVARGDVITHAKQTFENFVAEVADIVEPLQQSLREKVAEAHEITIELGVKLSAELGVIVAKSQAEANFKISVTWKK
jgi:Trypsin-co-occurring domain 1